MTYPGSQPTLPNQAHNPGKRLLAWLSRWQKADRWQKVALFDAILLLLVCACSNASLSSSATPYGQQTVRTTAATHKVQTASATHEYSRLHPAATKASNDTSLSPANSTVAVATGTAPPPHYCGCVIFSDDFSGSYLGPAWTIINRHGEYAQGETECNVPGAVSVANNMLTITTTAQSATCGDFNLDHTIRHDPSTWPYTTGDMQWTGFAFTYGTITYRAKFPPQDTATWPAIWLLGSNCQATNIVTADTGYASCPALQAPGYVEIDMTECYGAGWCHLALGQPSSWPSCQYPVDSSWHTFTFVWAPGVISISVDGQDTGCSYSAADGYVIPSTPMFLLIQTQTGGAGGYPNDNNLPTTLQVSSVTVSQP